MPGDTCVVCGNTRVKDPSVSMHRFPQDKTKRLRWLKALGLKDDDIGSHHRVCSRHFPEGDAKSYDPQLSLGKRFASPTKRWTGRAKRAKRREAARNLFSEESHSKTSGRNPSSGSTSANDSEAVEEHPLLVTQVGEQLETEYQLHELPTDDSLSTPTSSRALSSPFSSVSATDNSTRVLVDKALLSRIELLEAENKDLNSKLSKVARKTFSVEDVAGNDDLVKLYTGFTTYSVFLAFYEFLGPSVNELAYRGVSQRAQKRQRRRKIDSLNQLFLTLIKLRLNLRNKDLAFRFGICESLVSRYVTTWISYLYHHLKEVKWMPEVEQVRATLPHSFQQAYSTTFAIIDGSELFIQTPSDLQLQSSTWSSYKHHNTAKFLIACTPNGCICFISPLYVGSISDVELTRVSGFLQELEGKDGISVMADRGFTIKDQLKKINVELNIPPFLDGRQQLPADEVKRGRQIASLRIHVERAIGRIKQFAILQGNFPLSMVRQVNQIVCVCAWLTNFHPALIPPPLTSSENAEVEEYFNTLESESDFVSTDSD